VTIRLAHPDQKKQESYGAAKASTDRTHTGTCTRQRKPHGPAVLVKLDAAILLRFFKAAILNSLIL
jgi:hypothetical protein